MYCPPLQYMVLWLLVLKNNLDLTSLYQVILKASIVDNGDVTCMPLTAFQNNQSIFYRARWFEVETGLCVLIFSPEVSLARWVWEFHLLFSQPAFCSSYSWGKGPVHTPVKITFAPQPYLLFHFSGFQLSKHIKFWWEKFSQKGPSSDLSGAALSNIPAQFCFYTLYVSLQLTKYPL